MEKYKDSSEDWGQSFDDMDGGHWVDHMSGPDDDDIEKRYEDIAIAYEEEDEYDIMPSDYNEQFFENEVREVTNFEFVSRKEEIVAWLADSELARKCSEIEGFYVLKGPHVRLKDGSIVDLLEWLFEEGIKGGSAVAGYSIVYSKLGSEHGEKLSFCKNIFDVPFDPRPKENQVKTVEHFDELF